MAELTYSWASDGRAGLTSRLETYFIQPGDADTRVDVISPSSPSEFNSAVANFRESVEGPTLFRGQNNLYGRFPIASAYRTGSDVDNRLLFEGICRELRAGCGEGEWMASCRQCADSRCCQLLLLNNERDRVSVPKYVFEGIWQHYVGDSRWLDVVDNPWIALWMASRKFQRKGVTSKVTSIDLPKWDVRPIIASPEFVDDHPHVFVYLIGLPRVGRVAPGLGEFGDNRLLDLRQSVSGAFLRPHSQQGLLLDVPRWEEADVAVSVLKIGTMDAIEWLGSGMLFDPQQIFPKMEDDLGFAALIELFVRYSDKIPGGIPVEYLPGVYLEL